MAKKTVHHQESLLQKQMTIYFLFAHDDASKVIEFEMKSMARDTKASSEKDFPLLLLWTTSIKDIKGSLTAVFKYDTIQEIRASWNQFRKKNYFPLHLRILKSQLPSSVSNARVSGNLLCVFQ